MNILNILETLNETLNSPVPRGYMKFIIDDSKLRGKKVDISELMIDFRDELNKKENINTRYINVDKIQNHVIIITTEDVSGDVELAANMVGLKLIEVNFNKDKLVS